MPPRPRTSRTPARGRTIDLARAYEGLPATAMRNRMPFDESARPGPYPPVQAASTCESLLRRRLVIDEGGHDVLLGRGDGVVGGGHVRPGIDVGVLLRQKIHQRHPEVLPFGGTDARDQRDEI